MKRRLDLSLLALDDLRDARDWYDAQQPGIGSEFIRSVDAALACIYRTPHVFPMVYENVRRCLTRRFPYGIFFVEQPDTLLIVAIYHTHRNPRDWQARNVKR